MADEFIQLAIEGTVYPEASGANGSYACYDEDLSVSDVMASGRMVFEVRGRVRHIDYQYPYFDDELMKKCLSDLRTKKALDVIFAIAGSDTPASSKFVCTSIPNPKYKMSVEGKVYWTDISFSLREIDPYT